MPGSIPSKSRVLRILLPILLTSVWLCSFASGQETAKAPATASSSGERGISLAGQGKCKEALPLLKKAAQVADKNLRYDVLMATARCAMSVDQRETAVRALLDLNREFPRDPDVLYTTTHFYSELASKASQELAATAPTSPEAEQLEAEAYESQGDWEKATAEYKKILEQTPARRNIHYRLGRVYLSKTPADSDAAKKEFEEELKIDPGNASAEFLLGEIARQAGQWDDAAVHFSKASKLDEEFQEAYLALGMSLNSAGKFPEAIEPLKAYVKMQPADPAGHYQLATAYARTGHKPEAEHEMELQRETAAKAPREGQH